MTTRQMLPGPQQRAPRCARRFGRINRTAIAHCQLWHQRTGFSRMDVSLPVSCRLSAVPPGGSRRSAYMEPPYWPRTRCHCALATVFGERQNQDKADGASAPIRNRRRLNGRQSRCPDGVGQTICWARIRVGRIVPPILRAAVVIRQTEASFKFTAWACKTVLFAEYNGDLQAHRTTID